MSTNETDGVPAADEVTLVLTHQQLGVLREVIRESLEALEDRVWITGDDAHSETTCTPSELRELDRVVGGAH